MSIFSAIKIIAALPSPLSPNTIYFVRAGVGFDLYCSDSTGSIAHKINSLTSSEILASLLTVDGSGSGLDADLLDGQEGTFYQNANNLNTGTLPTARLPAFTGDVTSTVGSNALTLINSGVTAGTYRSITVDAKGRVTSGTNPTDWGVTRNLTIGNETKAVNGSQNLTWTINEIGVVGLTGDQSILGTKSFDDTRNYQIKGSPTGLTGNQRAVILLHERWISEDLFVPLNYCYGTFTFSRGSNTAVNRAIQITIATQTARNNNLYSVSSNGLDIIPRIYECTYQGFNYVALEIPFTAAVFTSYKFVGGIFSSIPNSLLVVPYFNEETQTILNEEVYNSLTEVTDYNNTFIRGTTDLNTLRIRAVNNTNIHTVNSLATASRTFNLPDRNINLDSDYPRITSVPATPTSTGIAGQVAYDSNYFYICTAVNTWAKVKISETGFSLNKYAVTIGNGVDNIYTVNHNLGSLDVVVNIFYNDAPHENIIANISRINANIVQLAFEEIIPLNKLRVVVIG